MIKDNDCFYCSKDQRLYDRMIKIADLKCSTLFLNRDQTYKGRCIVSINEHKTELFEINEVTLRCFIEDVARAASIINAAFSPDKVNYAVFGDLVSHIHFHIVPKHKNGLNWGEAFENEPEEKVYLSDAEYEVIIGKIKEHM